jgi:hypothetical protein
MRCLFTHLSVVLNQPKRNRSFGSLKIRKRISSVKVVWVTGVVPIVKDLPRSHVLKQRWRKSLMDNKEPELTDVGTRYEHLKDYAEALQACAEILENRGLNTPSDYQKFIKFKVSAELAQHTVDNFAGYKDTGVDLYINRLLSVPKAEEIEGGRGTPLQHDYKPWNDKVGEDSK